MVFSVLRNSSRSLLTASRFVTRRQLPLPLVPFSTASAATTAATATATATAAATSTAPPKPSIPFKDSHIPCRPSVDTGNEWTLPHNIWDHKAVETVTFTHEPPKDWIDELAYNTIRLLRFNFDWMSGYSFGKLTYKKALTRVVFLETVAGVPGSIGATLRQLRSLRLMKRDNGWIHTLLEEAENEKQHLLTFVQMRNPGPFLRSVVFVSQGVFFNFFFLAYLVSPRFCHRMVGYLEEQAVKTYTHIIQEIDNGELQQWQTEPAPVIAKNYWQLGENATIRDLMLHIRADEAHHRDVNHHFSKMKPEDRNPFLPGR